MNRTIQIKLSNRTIVACYQIRARYKKSQDISMEQAVKLTLEALLDVWKRQGEIVCPDSEEEAERWLEHAEVWSEYTPLFKDASDEESQNLASKVSQAVQETIKRMATPTTVAAAPVELPDEIDRTIPMWTFDYIKQSSPKDMLIEWVDGMEDGQKKLAMEAIQIVYSGINRDLWGTPKAKELVDKTIAHLGHLNTIKNN